MYCGNSDWVSYGLSIVGLSLLVNHVYRYTGWLCRGMVSATTYTLVGVVNKFLTVLLNVLVWDKHSTGPGLFAVCLCLAAGSLYQQAPKKEDKKLSSPEPKELKDIENQPLLRK